MTVPELENRVVGWLRGEYEATLAHSGSTLVGYALYRRDPEYVYLRQLFVISDSRRQGVGRAMLQWLWSNAWIPATRLRIDVLAGNIEAQNF